MLARVFNMQDEVKDGRKNTIIIAIAVIINTFISAAQGSFAVFESQIVFPLSFLLPAIVAFPLHMYAFFEDPIGTGFLLLIYSTFCFYQPWLYFTAFYQGYKASCPVYFWLFRRFDIYVSSWAKFSKFSAILSCVLGFLFLIAGIVLIVWGFIQPFQKARPANERPTQEVDLSDDEKEEDLLEKYFPRGGKNRMIVSGSYYLAAGGFSILSIELTLSVNKVDITSPLTVAGQLIPFLIGLLSLLTNIWAVSKKYADSKKGTRGGLRRSSSSLESVKGANAIHIANIDGEEMGVAPHRSVPHT
jgi:flagellar basal body-associated protein FliL